jgi:hypothetical protein
MKMNIRLLLFWAVIGTQEVWAQRITPDVANLEYANVDGISLKLDLHLPKNVAKPYPVIVWIHGGGWVGGSKENPTAASMVQQGYAVVSINYRLSGQAIFPAQIHDCKAAIRWIRANAAQYGFNYVSSNDPPFLVQHGTEDMTVPFHQSVELDSALKAVGVNVQFQAIANTGHGGGGFAADSTRRQVSEFFVRHLKTPTPAVYDRAENASEFRLEQNYPNPFNPSTTIHFSLPQRALTALRVFDVNGREVATLVNGELRSGEHVVVFDAKNLPSGVYIYRVQAGNFVEQKKMEVIK